MRSEEPYRLHCYSFLASLDTSSRSSQPDAHGKHTQYAPSEGINKSRSNPFVADGTDLLFTELAKIGALTDCVVKCTCLASVQIDKWRS